jgi:protein TonB
MLLRAALVSLLIHVILLVGSRAAVKPFHLSESQNAEALTAMLANVRESAPEKQMATANANKSAVMHKGEVATLHVTKETPPQARVLPPLSRSTAVIANKTPEIRDSVRSKNAVVSPTAKVAPISAVAESAISADGIRRYRLSLAREARQYQSYPQLARERGWQGTVVLNIQVGLVGDIPRVNVESSSGIDLLDTEAQAMMLRAARQAVLPDNLIGKRFSISLPVDYSLNE